VRTPMNTHTAYIVRYSLTELRKTPKVRHKFH